MIDPRTLPHVDEHDTEIDATLGDVWSALLAVVERTFSQPASAAYARIVACDPASASGPRPLTTGSEVPGFRVAAAVPGSELVLVGRHHFSTYAMVVRLDPVGTDRTRLRAETRAAFPGFAGRGYRLLVIGSRGHVLGMRRLLSSVRRRAEQDAGTTPED